MKPLFLTLSLFLSGCMLGDPVLDRAGEVIVDEAVQYCGQPEYRRKALGTLVNGRLAESDIQVIVCCPGDTRIVGSQCE